MAPISSQYGYKFLKLELSSRPKLMKSQINPSTYYLHTNLVYNKIVRADNSKTVCRWSFICI